MKEGAGLGVHRAVGVGVELPYRVACERKRLLIGGKAWGAWGAWCCVAVWVGERWFALISRGRVVVALVFARQSVVGVVFLFVCTTHAERKH